MTTSMNSEICFLSENYAISFFGRKFVISINSLKKRISTLYRCTCHVVKMVINMLHNLSIIYIGKLLSWVLGLLYGSNKDEH